MKELSKTQKVQIMQEFKELQKNGSIGDSLLRTVATQNPSSNGAAFDMEMVARGVALELAFEYIEANAFVVVGQSPQGNFTMGVFLNYSDAEMFIESEKAEGGWDKGAYIEEFKLL